MGNNEKKNKPTPPTRTSPAPEPEAAKSVYRVPISDTSDDKHPRVRTLLIEAESQEGAYTIASELVDPFSPTPGILMIGCRFEEVLPYLREGFSLRRDHWPITEVMLKHPHVGNRLDLYMRNPDHPHHRVQYKESATLDGSDLLSEDWSVCARPPYFA